MANITEMLSWLILALGASIVALTIWTVIRTYSPVLFWDHWDIIRELMQHHNRITPGELWAQHNEHRIPVGRLLFYADLFWFGGTNKSLLAESVAAQLFLLLLFTWVLARFGKLSRSSLVTAIGLLAYCLFSPLQINNFVWAFQVPFLTAAVGALSCFVSALSYAATPAINSRRRNVLLILCMASALIAEGSLASGLLTWPLLCLLAFRLRFPRKHQWIIVAAAAVALAAYLRKYHSPQAHSNPLETITEHPLGVLKFILTELGWSWDGNLPNSSAWPALSESLTFLALLVSVWAIFRYIVLRKKEDPIYTFLCTSVLYALATVALSAVGRLQFGLQQATESRYQSLALLFWALVFLLGSVRFGNDRRALFAIQVGCLLFVLSGGSRLGYMMRWAEGQQDGLGRGWAALINNTSDTASANALYYDLPVLRLLAKYLYQQHWGPFPKAPALTFVSEGQRTLLVQPDSGSTVTPGQKMVGSSNCSGFLDGAKDVAGGTEITVTGWAWDSAAASPPSAVRLITENGTPIGSAQLGAPRLDVAKTLPQIKSQNTGWILTLSAPRAGKYHAFAILHADQSQCELSNELVVGP